MDVRAARQTGFGGCLTPLACCCCCGSRSSPPPLPSPPPPSPPPQLFLLTALTASLTAITAPTALTALTAAAPVHCRCLSLKPVSRQLIAESPNGLRSPPLHLLPRNPRRPAQVPSADLPPQGTPSHHLQDRPQKPRDPPRRRRRRVHHPGGARRRAARQHAALRAALVPARAQERPRRRALRAAVLHAAHGQQRAAHAVCGRQGADAQHGRGGEGAGGDLRGGCGWREGGAAGELSRRGGAGLW